MCPPCECWFFAELLVMCRVCSVESWTTGKLSWGCSCHPLFQSSFSFAERCPGLAQLSLSGLQPVAALHYSHGIRIVLLSFSAQMTSPVLQPSLCSLSAHQADQRGCSLCSQVYSINFKWSCSSDNDFWQQCLHGGKITGTVFAVWFHICFWTEFSKCKHLAWNPITTRDINPVISRERSVMGFCSIHCQNSWDCLSEVLNQCLGWINASHP